MSKPMPKYTLWEAINVAIALGTRALEEIRTLARTPGPRGADGMGFDDLKVDYDGERTFTFRLTKGDKTEAHSFALPIPIYRGVFREGEKYVRGDNVTWGGSTWVALKENATKPGDSADWQLSCKKGRDGKEVVAVPRDYSKPVKINGPDNA